MHVWIGVGNFVSGKCSRSVSIAALTSASEDGKGEGTPSLSQYDPPSRIEALMIPSEADESTSGITSVSKMTPRTRCGLALVGTERGMR